MCSKECIRLHTVSINKIQTRFLLEQLKVCEK